MEKEIKQINDFEDVIYCKAEGNYTKIFFQKKSVITTKVLRCFESILPMNDFFRIHKSYLVNSKYVIGLTPENRLILRTREELPISRRRKSLILRELSKKKLILRSR